MYQKLRTGKNGQELGYHSSYNLYKVVNVMFNQAIRWEIMDKNPNLKANKQKKKNIKKKTSMMYIKLRSCYMFLKMNPSNIRC